MAKGIEIEKGVQSKISMLNDKLNKELPQLVSNLRVNLKERVGRVRSRA